MDEIHQFMEDLLLSISQDVSVTEAAKFMRSNEVTSLLAEEKGEYVGIITDVDFTRKVIAADADPDKTKVSSVMTRPIITLDRDQSMGEAFLCMRKNQIRHILVTEGEKIVGNLSLSKFAVYGSRKFGKSKTPIEEFWSNYECLLDENAFMASVDKLKKDIRKTLDDSTLTAQAIDNNEPVKKISECAKKEGYDDFAGILDLAEYG